METKVDDAKVCCSCVSVHVLDTAKGIPAEGVKLMIFKNIPEYQVLKIEVPPTVPTVDEDPKRQSQSGIDLTFGIGEAIGGVFGGSPRRKEGEKYEEPQAGIDLTFGIGEAIGGVFGGSPRKKKNPYDWDYIAEAVTDKDGREKFDVITEAGIYKIIFYIENYFEKSGVPHFHPMIEVIFRITDPISNHHIPLLLSPFGYSTYRGS